VSPVTAAPLAEPKTDPHSGGGTAVRSNDLAGVAAMTEVLLSALTRAWFTTVIASTLLLTALATEPIFSSAAYWRGLPEAFALVGGEGPLIVDRWDPAEAAAKAQAARAGHTGW
jgi:hypothetical protein